jgi:S-(hydroxymethyl)glutathione dehydrogenase/alcohol dehydrogenase
MEYAIISENRLVPIPSSIPLREAALFGCAIPTGAGIVFNDLNMPRGSSLAVFGLGGIGLSAILAARFKEARQIIAIDRGKAKLHLALELGATQCIDVQTQDPLMAIAEMTQGLGVDFAIEAVGQKVAMETAFKAVKDKGGVCILAGNVPKGTCLECDPFDFIKGKKMMGTWGGGVDPDRDIPLFLENFRDVQAMISQEAPLHEINQVIELLEKGSVARAFIKFNGSRTD